MIQIRDVCIKFISGFYNNVSYSIYYTPDIFEYVKCILNIPLNIS